MNESSSTRISAVCNPNEAAGGRRSAQGSDGQPVTHSNFSQQVLWLRRIGFQFLAQLGHVNAQVITVLDVGGAPDLCQQLAVGQNLTGIAEQALKPSQRSAIPASSGTLEGATRANHQTGHNFYTLRSM
jgi:hypothetical protein